MAGSRIKRWSLIFLILVLVLVGAGVIGFRIATERLKSRVAAALGPGSELGALKVRWSAVEVEGVTLRAPGGWPASRTLHAERVRIVPSLRSLLTDQVRIASITVDKPYLSVLRTQGKLLLVPTLLQNPTRRREGHGGGWVPSSRSVSISEIALKDGVIELFDATVGRSPLKLRFERIDAVVRGVNAPSFQEQIHFELTGVVKGVNSDGRVKISGWLKSGGKDSSSWIVLNAVDLVKLQPYLVRSGEARVSRGTLDLDLKSDVRNHVLDGKGKIVFRRIEFEPSRNLLGTFMGIPRSAVVAFLKNRGDEIEVDFTIKGDVRNPSFSLNETMATRVAAAVAEQLGVSIEGMAGNLEALGRKGLEGAGEAAGAIGSALRGLFGGGEKR